MTTQLISFERQSAIRKMLRRELPHHGEYQIEALIAEVSTQPPLSEVLMPSHGLSLQNLTQVLIDEKDRELAPINAASSWMEVVEKMGCQFPTDIVRHFLATSVLELVDYDEVLDVLIRQSRRKPNTVLVLVDDPVAYRKLTSKNNDLSIDRLACFMEIRMESVHGFVFGSGGAQTFDLVIAIANKDSAERYFRDYPRNDLLNATGCVPHLQVVVRNRAEAA